MEGIINVCVTASWKHIKTSPDYTPDAYFKNCESIEKNVFSYSEGPKIESLTDIIEAFHNLVTHENDSSMNINTNKLISCRDYVLFSKRDNICKEHKT